MMTRSPVTSWKPRRSAAPFPPFCAWKISLNFSSSASRVRMSRVPSFDPSSTTINSTRTGTASTRRMISSMVVRSL